MSDQIRAVAFQEGDAWVVQGIEYDVVAQASNLDDAPAAFLKTLVSTILINRKLKRSDWEGIRPAPVKFRRMFEQARVELNLLNPPYVADRPDVSLRAYRERAA